MSSMVKIWFLVLLVSVTSNRGIAQRALDVAPSGRPNERAVMGGSQKVTVETNVPLHTLIQRLNGNWRLVQTGKGYWIGYTKDMYSIASQGERAILPLVEFAHSTSSDHARNGALLTLHLIGIESRVAGRFYEEFKSKSAREALYGFLEDTRLRDEVLLLLVRDPWLSDVPRIMRLLAQEADTDCRPTVNALFRYDLNCLAFGGTLPDDASSALVFLVEGKKTTALGQLTVLAEEGPNEGVAHNDIIIQWRPNWTRKLWKFTHPEASRNLFAALHRGRDICEVTYDALRKDDFVFRYCSLDDPFNFQVAGTNVYIMNPAAAKARWLEWWGKQSEQYKRALESTPAAVR